MALSERVIAPNAAASYRLETRGQTGIERVVSLVLLGDLVSIYLAALRGVDPGPGDACSTSSRRRSPTARPCASVLARPRSAATGSGPPRSAAHPAARALS